MPLRLLLAAALLLLVAAGCGNKDEDRTFGATEGLYLDVGGLSYQLQLSRYINPTDIEDRSYLVGLPASTAVPSPDETWFGVWVRVQNESDEPLRAATTWEIEDTQKNIYRPIPIDPDVNPWVYESGIVPPNTVWPLASSAAAQGPVQGQLLVFKLKNESLQNRPLELHFSVGGQSQRGTYVLDV